MCHPQMLSRSCGVKTASTTITLTIEYRLNVDGRVQTMGAMHHKMITVHGENGKMDDYINRQAAIKALREALYDYEDKTEKQFLKSDELDIYDWIQHRIFVQNMSDIDVQVILNLPSADVQPVVRCKDCKYYCEPWCEHLEINNRVDESFYCGYGARMDGEQDGETR